MRLFADESALTPRAMLLSIAPLRVIGARMMKRE